MCDLALARIWGGDFPAPPMGTTPEALCAQRGQKGPKDILCNFTRNDYHIDRSEVIALLNWQPSRGPFCATTIVSLKVIIWADVTASCFQQCTEADTAHARQR